MLGFWMAAQSMAAFHKAATDMDMVQKLGVCGDSDDPKKAI